MKPRLLLLGTTFLLGGSLALVALLTHEAPPVTEPMAAATAEAPAVAGPPSALEPQSKRPPPWALAAVAHQASASREWKPPQLADPSAPGKADRATRKAVRKALLAAPVEEELARCVDRDREVWFGGGWASPEPIPRAQPAILLLRLEAVGTQVKIIDARVKNWGGASRAAVACARDALVGRVVAAGNHQSASSTQMTFLLSPRSAALATAR